MSLEYNLIVSVTTIIHLTGKKKSYSYKTEGLMQELDHYWLYLILFLTLQKKFKTTIYGEQDDLKKQKSTWNW